MSRDLEGIHNTLWSGAVDGWPWVGSHGTKSEDVDRISWKVIEYQSHPYLGLKNLYSIFVWSPSCNWTSLNYMLHQFNAVYLTVDSTGYVSTANKQQLMHTVMSSFSIPTNMERPRRLQKWPRSGQIGTAPYGWFLFGSFSIGYIYIFHRNSSIDFSLQWHRETTTLVRVFKIRDGHI